MRIKLSAEAAEEMLDSVTWYDQREPGLGAEFLAACNHAFAEIAMDPARNLCVGRGFHRYLMRRFPFAIFYELQGDALIIAAIFHGARDAQKWRKRLGLL